MFVLFLSFVFLSMTVSRTAPNNNTVLKNLVQQSITHVKKMLANIGSNIEEGKKVLSKMDYHLSNMRFPGYKTTANQHLRDSTATNLTTTETPVLPQDLFPAETPTTIEPATTTISFVGKLKQTMAQSQFGYFITFLIKFFDLIATKPIEDVSRIIEGIVGGIHKMIDGQKLTGLGDLQASIKFMLSMMEIWSTETLQNQAAAQHEIFENKEVLINKELNAALDYYDDLFTDEEGEALFASLDLFDQYPDAQLTSTETGENMLHAMLVPFKRVEGTLKERKFLHLLHQAIQAEYPNWRAIVKSSTGNTSIASPVNTRSSIPWRRSMNINKILRHFLLKHPKLQKMFKRHHRHTRKSYHHHLTRRHHHHDNHKRRGKNGHSYAQSSKRKGYTESEKQDEIDTSVSGAYYREPRWNKKRISKKNINKGKNNKKNKNRLYRRHEFEKEGAPYTFSMNLNSHNFRRSVIVSSEQENDKSYDSQNSVNNSVLHKIIEASSYSDEEDYLRTNVYDALRHGNRTFLNVKSHNINNQTLRDSSSGPDDEWVIKNNIYKAFEQKQNDILDRSV